MRDFPLYSGAIEECERREFFPFVEHLAQLAGAVIRQYHLTEVMVETKANATPVTQADRSAELKMRECIMQRYPEHGVLGEEYGEHQATARYRWVLDPIDGTKSFVANSFLFGCLIALLRDGRPILGAIAHPLTGHLLLGDGRKTYLNGRPVRVRKTARVEEAVLLTTDHWTMHERCPRFAALSQRAYLYRTWGDCHGYFLVATGGADLMFDPVVALWDIMALIPVIEGAGGRITDAAGQDPVYGNSLLASNGILHEQGLTALSQ